MSTAAATTDDRRALDDLSMFLPPTARRAIDKVAHILEHSANVPVDEAVTTLMELGEQLIGGGLDATVDGLEALVARAYEAGWMERLGGMSAFLRDGVEIGLQVAINALKSLTPADVAKIVGIALIAAVAPSLLLTNGPEFIDTATSLALKLWHLG